MKSLTRDKEISPEFNAFWAAYPKRAARKDAWKAWWKLNPSSELVERMMLALAWQTKQPDWLKEAGKFVPYPATWIRGERWLDEAPVVAGENGHCRHTPPCPTRWAHGQLVSAEHSGDPELVKGVKRLHDLQRTA